MLCVIRVVRVRIVADAELGYHSLDRGLPGLVKPVPEGEDAAVVAVQVLPCCCCGGTTCTYEELKMFSIQP